jgi:putative membrane-bound dehydrogenase-like protein
MMGPFRWLAGLLGLLFILDAEAAPPVPTDGRLVIELVAKEPDIVTPTGIAVDERGQIWVVENNTHERPTNYKGAASDRIRIFSDFDAGGHARKICTFAEGFKNAMSIALGKEGSVYLATRSDIYLLRAPNGNGVAKDQRVIVKLDTPGQYPHNGLSGFAFDGLGNLYFSLGENLGAAYKLVGSDGKTLSGGGEGGSIYRCRPDGSRLVRIATGFWNTFHLAFDAFGRLFAVDNDPDSRGPCRLLHIVPGGDYGYRFRNGRKGLHPFTAWNGELPGTLPMVAGTSEAPSGIVAYESDGLPADYRGRLLVTSWGDHVVESFQLKEKGASFTSQAQILVRGDEDFRPVGIATGPDGSLYLSDWVDKSYPVHGKGRIWRIRMKTDVSDDGLRPSQVAALDNSRLERLLAHRKREIRAATSDALAQEGRASKEILAGVLRAGPDRARVQALWAAAKLEPELAVELISGALGDGEPEVRGEAVRLLGELLPPDSAKKDETRLLAIAQKDPSAFVRLQAILQLRTKPALEAVLPILADKDPFLAGAALEVLGRPGNTRLLLAHADTTDPALRLGVLLALRRAGEAGGRAILPKFLADPEPAIRRAAIQWVGEERLREYAPLLKAAASRAPVTREVFEALLATNEFLAGVRRSVSDEWAGEEYVAQVVKDAAQPAAIRALALSMLRPDHSSLTAASLQQFASSREKALRWEAARTLALRADEPAQKVLRQLAADRKAEADLRAQAILGLALSAPTSPATQHLLVSLLGDEQLGLEALRSLREAAGQPEIEEAIIAWSKSFASPRGEHAAEHGDLHGQLLLTLRSTKSRPAEGLIQALERLVGPRPKGEAAWHAALTGHGDAAAGERVFFHPRGPRCFACHRVNGRGNAIGPDLSYIGRSLSREKLIDSIVTPSKEIAPQFTSWTIATRDGRVRTGMIVEEGPNSTVTVADSQGKLEVINRTEIEERHAVPTSIMPDNLPDLMTRREFLDLLAYLGERK